MAELDLNREIRRAVDTGKVLFGQKKGEKTLLTQSALMVIVTKNTPKKIAERMQHYCTLSNTPLLQFPGTGVELGAVCGKPFVVSVLLVKDEGNSKLVTSFKKQSIAGKNA